MIMRHPSVACGTILWESRKRRKEREEVLMGRIDLEIMALLRMRQVDLS